MPVEAAVAVEVAEIGGDRLRIPRVVAANRQRHLPLARLVGQRGRGGVGDVERPLVVAAEVAADLGEVHEHARRLTGAVEVEKCAATGERILRLQPRAIPAVPLVIPLVGIDGVAGIETVGQRNLRPGDVVARLVTSPHLPHAAERAAVVLPAVGQALPVLGGSHGPAEDWQRRRGYGEGHRQQPSAAAIDRDHACFSPVHACHACSSRGHSSTNVSRIRPSPTPVKSFTSAAYEGS